MEGADLAEVPVGEEVPADLAEDGGVAALAVHLRTDRASADRVGGIDRRDRHAIRGMAMAALAGA